MKIFTSKTIKISMLALFVIIGIVYLLIRQSSDSDNSTTKDVKSVAGKIVEVIIDEKGGFIPNTVVINAGDTISWKSKDEDGPHQIAANPHPTRTELPELYSAKLSVDEAYSYTFNGAGKYNYHDFLNPQLNGLIIVN